MPPRVWALCAFSRPERLGTVIAEFCAQTYRNKGLVLVENGRALGTCATAGMVPDLLLQSEPHQTAAKNVGLAALAYEPDDWFVTWDDDDYHAPGLLAELAAAAEPGCVIGKHNFFMRMSDGRLLRFKSPVSMLWGGTLAARVGDALPFEDTGRWGEDERWLADMRANGAQTKTLSDRHFIANRSSGAHAWAASDAHVLNSILGDRPDVIAEDFGFAPDSIVDGGRLPNSQPLAPRPFNWELARGEAEAHLGGLTCFRVTN